MEATVAPTPIRTLVVGKADLQAYADSVVREAQELLAKARAEYSEAEAGVAAAIAADEPSQVTRWRSLATRRRHRVEARERFSAAVAEGFLPIPRMPAVKLDWTERTLPPAVLESLAEAKESGNFEWFGVVDGTGATAAGWPTSGRVARRDPILVGVCCGELFPIAWWR